MSGSRLDYDLFYALRPGETWREALRNIPGTEAGKIRAMNPHLSDSFGASQIMYLGNRNPVAEEPAPGPLAAAQQEWQLIPRAAQAYILSHFDLLDKLKLFRRFTGAANSLSQRLLPLLNDIPATHWTGVSPDVSTVELLPARLLTVRQETLSMLNRLGISPRLPILFLRNFERGWYGLAREIKAFGEFAQRVKLEKKLLYLGVGIETAKAIEVALKTKDWKATGEQAARGATNILVGRLYGDVAKRICTASIEFGPVGVATCVVSVGTAAYRAPIDAKAFGDALFGKKETSVVPGLR